MKTPPSILFLNRVYPPADGATGQLLAELAPELVRRGHRVTVVTSQPGAGVSQAKPELRNGTGSAPAPGAVFRALAENSDRVDMFQATGDRQAPQTLDARARPATPEAGALPTLCSIDGVRVERVSGLPFTRASHWRRALSYLSLYPALLWRALRLPRADVIITMTDPPLLLVLGVILKTLKGSRHVHWAQDIYPELAEEMGVLSKNGMIARALRWVSTAGLRHADRVIAVGRCMKARLVQRGLAPSAIEVIPNWGHGGNSELGMRNAESFRTEHGLNGKFVVMYSGNLGLAHPFEAMLDAAERLRSTHSRVLFLFVGNGPRLPWVREQVAQRKLENVRFLPFQPREKLAQSLAAADLHLASMLHELCGLVVPSKVYGVLSVGRPCVFLGPEESEAAQFILQNGCGSVLAKATGARLASCLAQWAGDPALLRETRDRVEAMAGRVSLATAVRAFSETLAKVGGSNSFQPETKAAPLTSPLGTSSTS